MNECSVVTLQNPSAFTRLILLLLRCYSSCEYTSRRYLNYIFGVLLTLIYVLLTLLIYLLLIFQQQITGTLSSSFARRNM